MRRRRRTAPRARGRCRHDRADHLHGVGAVDHTRDDGGIPYIRHRESRSPTGRAPGRDARPAPPRARADRDRAGHGRSHARPSPWLRRWCTARAAGTRRRQPPIHLPLPRRRSGRACHRPIQHARTDKPIPRLSRIVDGLELASSRSVLSEHRPPGVVVADLDPGEDECRHPAPLSSLSRCLSHVVQRRSEHEPPAILASMPAPLIEFPADDPDRALRFWRGVLGVALSPRPAAAGSGWQADTDNLRLGVHDRGPGPGDTASLPYFTVADLPRTLERVREFGGSIIHPGDQWAVCRDSEGSPFALAAASAIAE